MEVVVTVPKGVPEFVVEKFVEGKKKWIEDTLEKFRKIEQRIGKPAWSRLTAAQKKAEYAQHKDAALALATARLAHFNAVYGFTYKRVSIRNQKSRWGSCSVKGNLSFNYKIALLPARLADYVIVHELCHLGEFNHSRKFWALVARTVPDYAEIKKEMRRYHL